MKTLLVLLLLASTAHADALTKKDAYWAAKSEKHAALRKIDRAKLVGKKPAKVISIYNGHTDEWFAVDAKAKSLPQAGTNRLLRCHFTNDVIEMDRRLSGVLLEAARHFKSDRINIVSGYRAPKYNLILRKKGHRVARDSQHTFGHAVDFWLPGVSTEALYDWEMAHQIGGVGKYISDGFVHVDVGKKRTWIDP
jgi:uncharacterized protein YcbK (DUF882 family)